MEEKKNIPKLRFPGFSDAWEQRKLEDILTERHILSKISEEYPRLSFTIEEGVIDPEDRKTNKRDFLMKDEANKKFLLTELGDIIYNPANVVFGAIHRNSYGKGCLSPIYRIFETNQNSRFLECVVRSDSFIKKLAQKTEGSVVKLKTLKPEAFLEMNVFISPIPEEQEKIASYIDTIDNLITLQQRKCDEYKSLKKCLLQKMFPKDGEQFPEIRFPGFNDAWEQRKVKELCSISTGKSNTQDKVDDGEYPFYVRSPIIERSTKYLYDEEAVLTVGDGVGTGKVFHYVNGKYDLHQRCYRMYDFKYELNALYFYHTFSLLFYNRVMAMTAKTSVDSVRMEMIADMEIPVPNIDEQEKIGAFFTNIDNLITLQQRKCEELKELKKSLLQQMFV